MSDNILLVIKNNSPENFVIEDIALDANAEISVTVPRAKADSIVEMSDCLPITVEVVGSEATEPTNALSKAINYINKLEGELSTAKAEVANLIAHVEFLEQKFISTLPNDDPEALTAKSDGKKVKKSSKKGK